MSEARPLPAVDHDSAPYWQALREGALQLQRCVGCSALRWPPRAFCNRCRGFDAQWETLSGRGRIVSWVRTHQVFAPTWGNAVPYVTVQVALAEQDDLLLLGGWRADAEPRAGQWVRACFTPAEEGFVLLDWEPDDT
jgi:uncharacterized OB-fold protein